MPANRRASWRRTLTFGRERHDIRREIKRVKLRPATSLFTSLLVGVRFHNTRIPVFRILRGSELVRFGRYPTRASAVPTPSGRAGSTHRQPEGERERATGLSSRRRRKRVRIYQLSMAQPPRASRTAATTRITPSSAFTRARSAACFRILRAAGDPDAARPARGP